MPAQSHPHLPPCLTQATAGCGWNPSCFFMRRLFPELSSAAPQSRARQEVPQDTYIYSWFCLQPQNQEGQLMGGRQKPRPAWLILPHYLTRCANGQVSCLSYPHVKWDRNSGFCDDKISFAGHAPSSARSAALWK